MDFWCREPSLWLFSDITFLLQHSILPFMSRAGFYTAIYDVCFWHFIHQVLKYLKMALTASNRSLQYFISFFPKRLLTCLKAKEKHIITGCALQPQPTGAYTNRRRVGTDRPAPKLLPACCSPHPRHLQSCNRWIEELQILNQFIWSDQPRLCKP